MPEFLFERGRRLEDAFFQKRDAELLAKQRELEKMKHTQKALSEVSGITNPEVLKRLVDLDIGPAVLASLAVVPLVEVAWADGEIHADERKAIHDAVEALDTGKQKIDTALLESWLNHKPPKSLLEAWLHYIAGLCESLTPRECDELRRSFVDRAARVAEAAGGFLGLGRVSADEKIVIEKMERAFRKG